jgi:glutathione peroxidase
MMLGSLKSLCPACLLVPVALGAIGLVSVIDHSADSTTGDHAAMHSAAHELTSAVTSTEPPRPDAIPAGYKLTDADRAVIAEHTDDERFVLGHELKRITGEAEPLMKYHGKVVLLVNVASKCGLTPQYEGLERLYREHAKDGLVVLGLPANNFMGQEPGSNKEILEFCTGRYDVSFPMFEKISVKDDDVHPLYAQLWKLPKPDHEGPTWNFTKYLVGRDGRVISRFGPRTQPDDAKMVEAIAKALKTEG